ncbi:MAG: HlyD family efflux transporter periplasmic adaptor subunit [bacterium]|nr:HlyD family efflux transporter periplasmic adaptor subunit [bacterium]
MKKYKILIIIIIFAGVVFFAGKLLTRKKLYLKDEEGIIKVKRGDVLFSVNMLATIKPLNVVEIKSKATGEIIKMPVAKGDFMEEGALVAEIENAVIRSAAAKVGGELNAAKARFEKIKTEVEVEKERNQKFLKAAEDNLEVRKLELKNAIEREKIKEAYRKDNVATESELIKQEVDFKLTINDLQKKISELSKRKPVPTKELALLKLNLESAESEYGLVLNYLELIKNPIVKEKVDVEKFGIKQAELELAKAEEKINAQKAREKDVIAAGSEVSKKQEAFKIAEENLKATMVTAPIAGTILQKNFEKGQKISSEMLFSSAGAVVATMADISKVYINAKINNNDLADLKEGKQLKITADIFPENNFTGLVTKIMPEEAPVKNTKTSEITVEIANPDKLLKPDMNLLFKVIVKEAHNVLFVPNNVIQNVDNKKKVFVLWDGKPIPCEVKTGLSNMDFTEIMLGLDEGEIISKPERQK